GVAPWGKHERFREYPLTRLRGYGGHRVYVPFSSSLLDGALHASLGDNQCLVVGPEHLPNTPTLIGESDLDIDFWMRDSNAIGSALYTSWGQSPELLSNCYNALQ